MIGKELGNYRIIAPIGEGSLGVVYLAEHRLLGSKVALKRFSDPIAGDRDLRQRVITAARVAAKCRHPNLVTVFDLIDTDDHLAMGMELLEGESFAAHLKTSGQPASPGETWQLLQPVVDGVAYAHSQGIVHGALRPGNLLLAQCGGHSLCKATDLGLGGHLAAGTAPSEEILPWLHYAAPEQHADPDVLTPAADIFALGTLLFEAFSGTRPFHEGSAGALVNAIRTRRAPGLRSVRPSLSHALEDVIARALDTTPAARWPDCGAFTEALSAALATPAPATTAAPVPSGAPPPTASMPVAVSGPQPGPVQPIPVQPGPVQPIPVQPGPVQPIPVQLGPVQPGPPSVAQAPPQAAPPQAAPPQTAPPQAAPPQAAPAGPVGGRHARSLAPRPHLGRHARKATLRDDPVLAAMEPKSTARDKWIIAGTVGACLIALLVAMIVALSSEGSKSPSIGTSNSNANTDAMGAIVIPTPPKDAGPVAKNVTCETLRGNWSGVFYAGPTRMAHRFNGTVHGTPSACRATFRITTGQPGYVIQDFEVTIVGSTITFRGTRVDRSMSRYGYSKDTFVGTLNLAKTRFSGRVRDAKGVIGTVQMKKG